MRRFLAVLFVALATFRGDLIAGGTFTATADAENATALNHIARWDGATWSPLRGGANDDVRALTVYAGVLVVGGTFTAVDGRAASRIATWDGSAWAPFATATSTSTHSEGVSI